MRRRSTRRCLALFGALAALASAAGASAASPAELARWRSEAARVTIVRDDWGVAHIQGRSDADAVFGAIYAQAEDDFVRIESNYLDALGRRAEAEGEVAIWTDLRARLFMDPADLRQRWAAAPAWLRALTTAWADGLDFYLATHPATTPRVIRRFEPWMALAFSEGSIGGDVESVSPRRLAAFYGGSRPGPSPVEASGDGEPRGSNGIAIAPSNTRDGHALLLINPHTSFFFRSELQMTSDAGLDAYGASTWGQFFLYQGFNAHAGWMHTTSGVDAIDEFAETIVQRGGRLFYRYGQEERPVRTSRIDVAYRTPGGGVATRRFTVYRTHHGPIVRADGERWISVALMNRPVEALSQSWLRTKARDYAGFVAVADRYRGNSSNNTVFADDRGEIALLLPQFIPRRDDRFDYTRPVDGADPATDWRGLHPLAETPHLVDPASGWLMNTNDQPWAAAGPNSLRRSDYPRYMDTAGENARGVHAIGLLTGRRDFTLERLNLAAYDSLLPAFARLIPQLVAAWDAAPSGDPAKAALRDQIRALRGWNDRWAADSVATSLAVGWGEALWADAPAALHRGSLAGEDWLAATTADQKLAALRVASDRLVRDFGAWRTAWGEVNRFQRLTGAIVQPFSDEGASTPVPFTSSQWGSLASFGARRYPGTRRAYSTSGNSFVAVVEFGPRVRAVAVSAGGESGRPDSPHFDDQAMRYASGRLRDVYFYPDQLIGHVEKRYHPG